ncbi:MAG: polysaccharide biosynthesis protein [Firmicutes bacterium]|nr:polysaccharide biosynthesis protein [Bacillota bacterium]
MLNYKKDQMNRVMMLMVLDLMMFAASYYISYLLRFNFIIPSGMFWGISKLLVGAIMIKLMVFMVAGMYKTLWRYASIEEMLQVVIAVFIANAFANISLGIMGADLPNSVLVLTMMFDFILAGGVRLSYRLARRLKKKHAGADCPKDEQVLIFGAGQAGIKMVKDLMINAKTKRYNIVGFLDDDPLKEGKKVKGIPVLGNRYAFDKVVKQYNISQIIIACPGCHSHVIKEVAELAGATQLPVKILPGFDELLNYDVNVSRLRDLQIEDLLNRDEVELDKEQISAFIKGKRVMITGGGGSIGSELCRQIIRFKPREMIVLDIYENSLYHLELELAEYLEKEKIYGTTVDLEIASIRDKKRINQVFELYRPQVVFHAAAHKHVPLMEKTPKEAVKNNVFGTKNLLDASVKYRVEKFVQISTDKAVKPTNVMGATKRVCEILVQMYNHAYKTDFVAVRFGNVLGSNGSVIPIFKNQIASGGPITVTHKDITRYFMTIPEATQLVLQAGSIAKGGEIFVLNMGDSVKIVELAEKMIRLSGLRPYIDIPIIFTGLRPGEKLYEELSYNLKTFDPTIHADIFVENLWAVEKSWMEREIEQLKMAAEIGSDEDVINRLKSIVPDYLPNRVILPFEIEIEKVKEGIHDDRYTRTLVAGSG